VDHQVRRFAASESNLAKSKRPCSARSQALLAAAAAVREDKSGEKRLIAYFVGERELDVSELKLALRRELPDYMMPNLFVPLSVMPVTQSGKLDREALPDPDDVALKRALYVAPQTKAEEIICAVFADVLEPLSCERRGRLSLNSAAKSIRSHSGDDEAAPGWI